MTTAASPDTGVAARARLPARPAAAWAYVAAVAFCGAILWATILATSPVSLPTGAAALLCVALAVLAYASEAWVVHVYVGRQAHTVSINEVVVVVGLLCAGPVGLLFAQLAGPPPALAFGRRQRSIKLAFNVSQLIVTTGLAVVVFNLALGSASLESYRAWGAAMLAISVHGIVGVVLVGVAIGIAEGDWSSRRLARTWGFSLVGSIAASSFALAAVELGRGRPASIALLLVPTFLSGLALRSFLRQRQESERVRFLSESMRKTRDAADADLAARELLQSARHLLRGAYAEILLVSADGASGHRSTSSGEGEVLMSPAPPGDLDRGALALLHDAPRGIVLPRQRPPHALDPFLRERAIDDAVVSALRGEDRLLGLIVVGERTSDVATFEDGDAALLDTFAGHATVVLENNRLGQSLAKITELKEQLRHQVLHDQLTGLPNRASFADAVERALAQDGAAAVLFLDLDGFKTVNDTLGHAAGDELLVQVADRLRTAIRPDDTASRLGGDEFAIVLADAGAEGARLTAERILEALGRPCRLAGQDVVVHASIGIALADGSVGADDLIRNADVAMYAAKADAGRQYVFYEPDFHARLRRRRTLALELEQAVEQGRLEVHFQPVVDIADGTVHAFEALARWRHPRLGLLAADEFVPVAEENGLITEIGESVMLQATAVAERWRDAVPAGRRVGLWINLSAAELANARLPGNLGAAIASAGLDPRQIAIEVTESCVARDAERLAVTLQRLRALGVTVSIDDFGTGYSSLSRLRDLPIDMIKIPKPFVDRLAGPSPDVTIVDGILRLASSLGLTAVAEGVESHDQALRLRELGCPLAQGFLLGRPVEADETLRILRRGPGPLLTAVTAA